MTYDGSLLLIPATSRKPSVVVCPWCRLKPFMLCAEPNAHNGKRMTYGSPLQFSAAALRTPPVVICQSCRPCLGKEVNHKSSLPQKKTLPSFQTSTPMFGAETLVWACSSGEKEARSPEKQAHTSIKCA
jgi:hypothetical protein